MPPPGRCAWWTVRRIAPAPSYSPGLPRQTFAPAHSAGRRRRTRRSSASRSMRSWNRRCSAGALVAPFASRRGEMAFRRLRLLWALNQRETRRRCERVYWDAGPEANYLRLPDSALFFGPRSPQSAPDESLKNKRLVRRGQHGPARFRHV